MTADRITSGPPHDEGAPPLLVTEILSAIMGMSLLLDDGVLVSDGTTAVFANLAFEQIVSCPPGSLVGAVADSLIAPALDHRETSLRRVTGNDHQFTVRSVAIGGFVVTICRALPRGGTGGDRRLAELESVVRNISWELDSLRRVGGEPVSGLRDLSRREREILDAYLLNLSVSSVAERLHVSSHTVQSHLKAVYRKLGVRSKAELVRLFSSGERR